MDDPTTSPVAPDPITAASIPESSAAAATSDESVLYKQKADEYLNGWQRAKADYSNYKKEVETLQQEFVKYSTARLLEGFLPILDQLKTALKHTPRDSDGGDAKHEQWQQWRVGIEHISRGIKEFLKSHGVEEIPTIGIAFDPAQHDIVEQRPAANIPAQQIIEEVAGGYTLHGKVIRPAKVIVAE